MKSRNCPTCGKKLSAGTNAVLDMAMSQHSKREHHTLDSTFDLFGPRATAKQCEDCGSTEDLIPLADDMWLCRECKAKSARELQARIDAATNKTATWVAMDEWEEG